MDILWIFVIIVGMYYGVGLVLIVYLSITEELCCANPFLRIKKWYLEIQDTDNLEGIYTPEKIGEHEIEIIDTVSI